MAQAKKKDPQGGAPTSAKPPRRLMIALHPASAKLLRDISAKTKITITELLDHLENAHIDKAIDAELIARYKQWREDQLQDDFLKDRMPPTEKP